MDVISAPLSIAPIRVVDTLPVPQLQVEHHRPVEPPLACAEAPLEPWVCQPQCDPNAPPPWWWLQKWSWQPVPSQIAVIPEPAGQVPAEAFSGLPPDILASCQPHRPSLTIHEDQPASTATPQETEPRAVAVNYAYVTNLGTLMDVLC